MLDGGLQDPFRTRVFVNIVRIACAYAKLPDLNSMPASQFHGGYISRLHKISEQMFIDMSVIIRIIRQSLASNGKFHVLQVSFSDQTIFLTAAPETEGGQIGAPGRLGADPDQEVLIAAVDRMSRHAPMIAAAIDLHISSGVSRFRAAARTVLIDVHDRHYRHTWAFFKRHETLRKRFVAAFANKMRMDQAKVFWDVAMPGSKEAEQQYILLSREVSSAARPLWTALARLEYRRTVVHMYASPLLSCVFLAVNHGLLISVHADAIIVRM